MALPTTEDFLDLVRKSGLVEDKALTVCLDKLKKTGIYPCHSVRLANSFVKEALLTHFQAERLLAGKWQGLKLGSYTVLDHLGTGGMGSVYLAEHRLMKRRVALKMLPPTRGDQAAVERFYREAKAVAAVDHPNIVRAHDIFQAGERHFLVMEYVDGRSLHDLVKRYGPLAIDRAAHYVSQAAKGLQHIHEAGLVHRDIKPGNLLVDRGGMVKLLDLGLARFYDDEEDDLSRKNHEAVMGTVDYMSPEQAMDSHAVDIRSDIYSLGCTFYYLLTGKTPFSEGTATQKLLSHQMKSPTSIHQLRADVPDSVVAVLERMMAKDINERYQKPGDLVEALKDWTQAKLEPLRDSQFQRRKASQPKSGVNLDREKGSDVPLSNTQIRRDDEPDTVPSGRGITKRTVAPPPPPQPDPTRKLLVIALISVGVVLALAIVALIILVYKLKTSATNSAFFLDALNSLLSLNLV